MTTVALSNYATVSGSCVVIGRGACSTNLDVSLATGNTVIGAGAGNLLATGSGNVIIGDGSSVASGCGQCTLIGNNITCNATSGSARCILIGNGAEISATHTNVAVLGARASNTAIVDYGSGHPYYMPFTIKTSGGTLTGAEVLGGIAHYTTGAMSCTFPDDATIFDAMVDPVVGSASRLFIYKSSTGVLTLGTASLADYKGPATIGINTGLYFYLVVTSTSPKRLMVRASKTNLVS